jgi:hypothetical protein
MEIIVDSTWAGLNSGERNTAVHRVANAREDIRVMNLLYYGIRYKRIVVSSHAQRRLLRDLRDVMDTGERLSYLLYANLLDLNGQNIFDSLLLLFPYDPGMIRVARQHFEQLTSMLKQLRAMTSLPARQKLAARLQIDQLIDGNRRQLDEAVMQFVRCMRIVSSTEQRAIPDLQKRLEALNLQQYPAFRNIFEDSDL